jgi:hypothetical protein
VNPISLRRILFQYGFQVTFSLDLWRDMKVAIDEALIRVYGFLAIEGRADRAHRHGIGSPGGQRLGLTRLPARDPLNLVTSPR